jgi:nucleolar protein 15
MTQEKNTIYLGRIPHGFYESEMRSYFSQFGTVEQVHIPRNKKTGRFKHYAFVEFKEASVAKIAQETMDNYLLMNHQLVCKLVDSVKSARKTFKFINWKKLEEKKRSNQSLEKRRERIAAKRIEKIQKLKELGIDYSF